MSLDLPYLGASQPPAERTHAPPTPPIVLLDATDRLHRAVRGRRLSDDLAGAVETLLGVLGEYDYRHREVVRFLAAAQATGATVVKIDAVREAATR